MYDEFMRENSALLKTIKILKQTCFVRKNMVDVNLSHCKIGNKGFQIILEGMDIADSPEKLSLDLSDNILTTQAIKYILNYLKDQRLGHREEKTLHLKSLNLSKNMLKNEKEEKDCVMTEFIHLFF